MKTMHLVGLVCGLAACIVFFASFCAAAIDVGDRRQIFLDGDLIESSRNVTLTMNPPQRTGKVLIEADPPSKLQPMDFYGATVFKHPWADRAYLMLAVAYWHFMPYGHGDKMGPSTFDVQLCTSRDGKNFQRAGRLEVKRRSGKDRRPGSENQIRTARLQAICISVH